MGGQKEFYLILEASLVSPAMQIGEKRRASGKQGSHPKLWQTFSEPQPLMEPSTGGLWSQLWMIGMWDTQFLEEEKKQDYAVGKQDSGPPGTGAAVGDGERTDTRKSFWVLAVSWFVFWVLGL